MLGFAFFVAFVCICGLINASLSRTRKRGWVIGLFVAILVAMGQSPQAESGAAVSDNNATSAQNTNARDDHPAPAQAAKPDVAPAPPLTVQQQKKMFLATVDESITGKRIAGNPAKFLGVNVDLHGKVLNVLDSESFNFQAGSMSVDDDGNVHDTQGIILVHCASTSDLEADQAIRVIGTVVESTEGTNAMGGEMAFPTVKASYME